MRLLSLLLVLCIAASMPAFAQTVPNLAEGDFSGAKATQRGRAFSFDMGTERQNWTHARWSVRTLDEPMNLSAYQGLRIALTTDKPRTDAGVTVALREKDGTWRTHPWAGPLTQTDNAAVVRFADFGQPLYHNPPGGSFHDENHVLDTDAITAVAVGVVNPLGVGVVSFELVSLTPVVIDVPELEPATITITGRPLNFNGTTMVPAGLFGGFNLSKGHNEKYRLAADRHIDHASVDGTPRFGNVPIFINTKGDRVRPSLRLTEKDWKSKYENAGRSMGEKSKGNDKTLYVEFWNEPYLNWANYNRANFIPRFYNEADATEGGPVKFKHDGEVAPHLIWTKDRKYYLGSIFGFIDRRWPGKDHWMRGRDESGKVYSIHAYPYGNQGGIAAIYGGKWEPESHPPLGTKEGETYDYKGKKLTAFTPWHVVDTTQFTYWSGKGMLKHYIDPMLAFGKALKEANPDAKYIVGWGNRPSEDHWAGFYNLYKPTLDAAPELIDGFCDHDYGGDPTNLSASYEVLTTYMVTQHGKWLYGYNTECASSTDPQVYADKANVSADGAKFTWVTRKLLHALDVVPDKARTFLHFGMGGGFWSDGGEGVAMTMLRNVRGRLMHVVNDDQHILVVASVDGTDPANPRPSDMPDRKELVVVVLNDHTSPREVKLTINAPAGTTFTNGDLKRPTIGDKGVDIETTAFKASGKAAALSTTIPGRELIVLTLPLEGEPKLDNPVQRRQHFAAGVLETVTPTEPARKTIRIEPDALKDVSRAWLQITVERLEHGEGRVKVNGREYVLPAAVTPENTTWIRRVPLTVDGLRPENDLSFEVISPKFAGYMLGSASIVTE